MDNKLSFVVHIQNVCTQAMKALGFIICNTRGFKHVACLRTLYYAYIRSRLEFCVIIWSSHYETHVKTIENIQRKFWKVLSFIMTGIYPMRGYPHEQLLNEVKLELLHSRRAYHSVLFLYKLLQTKHTTFKILESTSWMDNANTMQIIKSNKSYCTYFSTFIIIPKIVNTPQFLLVW